MRPFRGTGSRCVRSVSASQHSVNEHPYSLRFRPIVTRSSRGVHFPSCRSRRPENRAFHDARAASADRARAASGGVFFLAHLRVRSTSDAPVAIPPSVPVRAFRGRAGRSGGTRRDRFHPAAVTRRSFSRSRTPSFDKRSAALAPVSPPAIAPPIPGSWPPGAMHAAKPELSLGRPVRCCAPRDAVCRLFVASGSLRHA